MEKFEKEFEKTKKELKLKSNLADMDKIFSFRDYINKEGFVSTSLSRQLCRRVADYYASWAQLMHDFVFVNSSSYLNMAESSAFSDEDKQKINTLLAKSMIILRTHSLLNVHEDKKAESEFMDDAVTLWKKEFDPLLTTLLQKVVDEWTKRSKAKPEKVKKEKDSMYG